MRVSGQTSSAARDARSHACLRLLARAISQADDGERRQPALDVRLDLDAAGIDTDERMRDSASEHVATLDDNL